MVKALITFRPAGDLVMIEVVNKQSQLKLHIPDSAKRKSDLVDLVVAAVGPDVKGFEPGDVVMCAPTRDTFKMDAGAGEKSYLFHREVDVFGKF